MTGIFLRAILLSASIGLSLAARCNPEDRARVTGTGEQAYRLTAEILKFGPRPPGSAAIEKVRAWIRSEVAKRGYVLQESRCTASTPIGEIEMKNLSYLIPGSKSGSEVVLVAHYDSKRYVGFDFVGANDAASSVALLLALTEPVAVMKLPFDVRVLFVDGEEALVNWTASDSLYGSKEYVRHIQDRARIKAVFVVDMVGDADLKFIDNEQSAPALRALQKSVLAEEGLASLMERIPAQVEDDHAPFVEAGLSTLHIMDFSYPAWHTENDTLDKISARSLSITGELILALFRRLT